MNAAATQILIVEDSLTQLLVLKNLLEKNGFGVATARDGASALESLRAQQFDLLITDIQMPGMDGYELCHTVKNDPALHELPVMLLTSLSAPQDLIRGLECGADNFVVKPYGSAFLLARVQTILTNQQLHRSSGLEEGIPIFFAGRKYIVTADRRQILSLLLSSYETAVQTNQDLIKTHEALKAAQAQLIEAEKMQSVGRLAAGLAHEVRNPLAILEMGISFLTDQPRVGEDRVVLDEMREAVRRANSVITGLTELAAPDESGRREMSVQAVLEQALADFAEPLAEAKIEVRREFGTDLAACRLDPAKMEQVFLNLFTNARDAMPDGGVLTVRTRTKILDQSETDYDAGDRSGRRFRTGEEVLLVEISDTGTGLAEENLRKVFDPFFSTKPAGQGMGLGLTVARKLLEAHGGRIFLRQRPTGGVEVNVLLKYATPSS